MFTSWRMNKCQQDHLDRKDRRLQKIVEILNHLKIIKFHVWEATFEEAVKSLRSDELESLKEFLMLQAFQVRVDAGKSTFNTGFHSTPK